MELEVGDTYEEPGATAEDDVDGDVTDAIEISGEVNTDEAGTYEVVYTVSDAAGNTATETRTVHVVEPEEVDEVAPEITLNGDNPMELEVGDTYEEPGATAEDDVDGDVTDAIEISGEVNTDEAGTYEVVYTVSDAAGNTATETRTVHVVEPEEVDEVAPEITLNGDNPMELEVGDTYEEPGATAEDDVDGDVTDAIEISGEVNTDEAGTYEVVYTVSDAAGNTATETRTVHVVEPEEVDEVAPEITLNGDNPMELEVGDTYEEPGATA